MPRIGLLYLAAVLQARQHQVQVYHLRSLNELRSVPLDVDFIGISATTREYLDALQIQNYLRRSGYVGPVAIGGPHATALSEECLRNGFDTVVVGDADETIAAMVEEPEHHRGVVRCAPVAQLDRLPFPARALLEGDEGWQPFFPGEDRAALTTSILLSRGCPYGCAFCGPHSSYRRRSPENLEQEVCQLRLEGYRNLVVIDDLPFLTARHLEESCAVMRAHAMRFRCNSRADLLTEASVRVLAASGCTRVQIGIESPRQAILDAMKKGTRLDHNARAIATCRAHGLHTKAMLIWGLPGDTQETADAIVHWVRVHRPDSVQLTTFVPLPGSPLWRQGHSRHVTDYQAMAFFDDPRGGGSAIAGELLNGGELASARHDLLDRLSEFTRIDRGVSEGVPMVSRSARNAV